MELEIILSIKRSLDYVGIKSIITNNKKIEKMFSFNFTWSWCFFSAMKLLKEKGLDKVIKDFAKSGKPV